jgi:hypothetical protein
MTYADWGSLRAGAEVFATCAPNFDMRAEFQQSGLTDRSREYGLAGLSSDGPRALWFRALWGDLTGSGINKEIVLDRRLARGFHLHPASHNTLVEELDED